LNSIIVDKRIDETIGNQQSLSESPNLEWDYMPPF
jgi:hypothetical protein